MLWLVGIGQEIINFLIGWSRPLPKLLCDMHSTINKREKFRVIIFLTRSYWNRDSINLMVITTLIMSLQCGPMDKHDIIIMRL